jgi:hypothetical protein
LIRHVRSVSQVSVAGRSICLIKPQKIWTFLLLSVENQAAEKFSAHDLARLKGIVSRKFDMLLLMPLDRYNFSTPFLLYPLLKISSLSCRIFDYKMFSGGALLSHNTNCAT